MSEIMKCPRCKEDPDVLFDLFDKHEKYPKGVSCCGAEFRDIGMWNKYASAMNAQARHDALVEAVAWERECSELHDDYIDTWLEFEAYLLRKAARAEVGRLLEEL